MIYTDLKLSLNHDDFLSPTSEQKFNLGEKITINRGLDDSLYSSTYVYIRCPEGLADRPFNAYCPYMIGTNFELDQYATPYEPNNVDVICTQFYMTAGQYGFALYQGEGLFLMEGTGDALRGAYVKAEGDIGEWGYQTSRVGATAGFVSETSDRSEPVKCVLFGHEVNVSPVA